MKSYIAIFIGLALHVSIVQAQQAMPVGLVTPEDMAARFKPALLPRASDKIHQVSARDFAIQQPTDPAFLAKQMHDIRALCPLLQQPVVLELEADRKDDAHALLNWKSENALYGTRYIIERSFDDTLHFETINYVLPQSSYAGKEKYDLQDANNYDRLSYYRVRLELRSGEQLYSNIATVKGYNNRKFVVFPNPARDVISLMANNNHDAVAGIKILDATGKIVWQKSGLPGKTFYQEKVNLAGFTNGMYMVKFELADNNVQTVLFIKQ